MPKVSFLPDGVTLELPSGTSLQAAADRAQVGLPFGCRAGTCGTCVIRVVRGADSLESTGFVEADTLSSIGCTDPRGRLACQLFLGSGDLEIGYED